MQPGNLLGNLLEFGGHLRRGGLDVHTGRVLDVIESLPHIDLSRRDDVYNTLRTLLVHRHDDFAVFDSVFTQFFGAAREQKAPREQASLAVKVNFSDAATTPPVGHVRDFGEPFATGGHWVSEPWPVENIHHRHMLEAQNKCLGRWKGRIERVV